MRRLRTLMLALLLAMTTIVPVQAQSRRVKCVASSLSMGGAVAGMFITAAFFPPVTLGAAALYASGIMVGMPLTAMGMTDCRR